jgi:hypothetical protein
VSIYAWMSGIETSAGTPFGTVETELSFGDVLENLDFAFFGTFAAHNGPWVVLGDLNYSDLSANRGAPVGANFADAEVNTTLTIASDSGGYAIVDRPDLRIEAGGGLRFYPRAPAASSRARPGRSAPRPAGTSRSRRPRRRQRPACAHQTSSGRFSGSDRSKCPGPALLVGLRCTAATASSVGP